MGTPTIDVYTAFLSKITQNDWITKDDLVDAEKDWFQLLRMSINRFMFPRISLDTICIENEENEKECYFVEELELGEIEVLATFMKYEWTKRQLFSWELMKQQYHTKDFEFFSPANLIARIQDSTKLAKLECRDVINIYKRSINGKPFNWSQLAGTRTNG